MEEAARVAARPSLSTSVLVIGRSENVLHEAVELLRANGHTAGATNDFEHVLALFDTASIAIVVFGGMVPPATKEALRAQLAEANPAVTFIQGLAGIPELIAEQVEAANNPRRLEAGPVTYDGDERTVTISVPSPEPVRLTAYWVTSFVPPNPQSTSMVIVDRVLDAGTHLLAVPASVPAAASFVVARVGTDVYPFVVGAMPAGTTLLRDGAVS